jgi:N-ethylmaleimide reductase
MTLWTPTRVGAIDLPHRLAMAPMTRDRSQADGVPTDLNREYYTQRASMALIITEGTQPSPDGQGYLLTPGIYTTDHIDGWRAVTDAVHAAGGRIVLQLWHVGRKSHGVFHADGLPVAPSAIAPGSQVWVAGDDGTGRMLDCPTPRALRIEEIPGIVEDYRRATARALEAGFDGVEIHGANGYLIDQFLRTTSNHRDDAYGSDVAGRLRFLEEVTRAVASEAGAERVGLRLAPFVAGPGMDCPEIVPTILEAARRLAPLGLAYLHLSEADWDLAPEVPADFRHALRAAWPTAIVVAGRYTRERGEALLDAGLVDAIAFGRPFIANPDLPARLAQGLPLATPDPETLFGGDAHGYTNYLAAA